MVTVLSPGMRINTRHIHSTRGTSENGLVHVRKCTSGGVYVPCIYSDVPLVEFMYLIFARMPGESYRR